MCYIQIKTMVRVRFAPSPTGYLHVGAARTALFNWLFARHHKGKFILRIEDTDAVRSSEEMSQEIVRGLKWLGLNWDEGPYFQSKRLEIYRSKARELVREGKAYFCYCLPEQIKERKRTAPASGRDWKYDRHCLSLSNNVKRHLESSQRPRAIRFLVPEVEINYTDLIHGPLSVKSQTIEDFVLLRSDGLPTYHLSVVVDDVEQKISHVIRGDDHISNTPKQILLYRAFGFLLPEFAHLALILGPDKKKLSKRHGVTSVFQFREEGYLPLALINLLTQMSWMPGNNEKIYSMEEMITRFSLDNLSKASPIFDLAKLEWLNGQLISQMKTNDLASSVKPWFIQENLWRDDFEGEKREWFFKLLDILKERERTLKGLALRAKPYITDEVVYDPAGVEKHLLDERLTKLLPLLKCDFQELENFTAENIELALRQRAEKEGIKAALLIHALRVLVLGEKVSPGIFNVLEIVGREKTLKRMDKLTDALDERNWKKKTENIK